MIPYTISGIYGTISINSNPYVTIVGSTIHILQEWYEPLLPYDSNLHIELVENGFIVWEKTLLMVPQKQWIFQNIDELIIFLHGVKG